MKTIKNFIYLDEYKMLSISAQMSGGITEFLSIQDSESEIQMDKQETHEGATDRKKVSTNTEIMGNILRSELGGEKHKILHDYSYSIFEEEISKSIVDVNSNNIGASIKEIKNSGFVRVKSKVAFTDIRKIIYTAENFNQLVKAIENFSNLSANQSNTNRNSRSRQTRDQTLDNKSMKELAAVLEFGYQDQFKVVMDLDSSIFEADCNREYLRDDEYSLIRKYSRFPEMEFVLVGIVTQIGNSPNQYDEIEYNQSASLKENVMSVTKALSDLESKFLEKLDNEIIIDPIAIFTEISIPNCNVES